MIIKREKDPINFLCVLRNEKDTDGKVVSLKWKDIQEKYSPWISTIDGAEKDCMLC